MEVITTHHLWRFMVILSDHAYSYLYTVVLMHLCKVIFNLDARKRELYP